MSQGRRSLFLCGQAIRENLGGLGWSLLTIVRSTISMRSMLMLGVSGGMPPQENFEKIDALRLNLGVFQSQYII